MLVGKQGVHVRQRLTITGIHILGMETHHGEESARIFLAKGEHRRNGLLIYIRQKDMADACRKGTFHHLGAVFVELLSVDMTVCIYHFSLLVTPQQLLCPLVQHSLPLLWQTHAIEHPFGFLYIAEMRSCAILSTPTCV